MNRFKMYFLALFSVLLLTQCTKDDDNTTEGTELSGELQFEITDAPSDDESIEGVFITVVDVKIDGESFEGFSGKKTIDIMAYQNGNVELLGLGELEAGTYSNISIVLDYESDVDGNTPGCYVLTTDNTKESLAASANSSSEILIASSFEIVAETETKLVADFDLRKSITTEGSSSDDYSFVSNTELNAAVRIANRPRSGNIKGNCSDNFNTTDKIVVYAYKKNTYDRDTEIQGQGSSQIEFKNAVTSTSVDASGQYQLSFLEDGDDYELVFVAYDDDDNDGKYTLAGTLEVSTALSLDLSALDVNAAADLTVDVLVLGVLPI